MINSKEQQLTITGDAMNQEKEYLIKAYQDLSNWLEEVKEIQKPRINEFIKQVKSYANAAENMSEEKVEQFINNLTYDLHDFYQQNKAQAKHSIYLGLLEETLWENLAQLTDKSQVEWAELVEDFSHDGIYKVGDVIGFGELVCQQCDEKIQILHVSEVAVCAKCGGREFIRLPLKP